MADQTEPTERPELPEERYPILRYFAYAHLPEHLQTVSRPFGELAIAIATAETHAPAETATALRKLLEAKDAAVRAAIPPPI